MGKLEFDYAWHTLANYRQAIIEMLKSIIGSGGKLNEEQQAQVVVNLCELQDLVQILRGDNGYYEPEVKTLQEFVKLGKEVLERYPQLAFNNILKVTVRKVADYLEAIGKGQGCQECPETHNLSDELLETKKRKLEEMLYGVASELRREREAALGGLGSGKTVEELRREKEDSLDEMVSKAANALIASHWRNRHVER